MRSALRGATAAALLFPSALAGCFVDAPAADDAASSSESGASTTSISASSSSSDTLDTVDTTTTSDTTTSTTEGATETTAAESSSTGNEPPQCGCPEPNLFCDGFEMYPGPWGMPQGGGGMTMQDNDDAMCGAASGRAAVVVPNEFAVLSGAASSAAELFAIPHSLRMFMRADATCGNQGDFVRLISFQYVMPDTAHIYSWQVAVVAGQVRLTATNLNTPPQSWLETTPLPDEWIELRLDVDFTVTPPTGTLLIDGEPWIQTGEPDAPALVEVADLSAPVAFILGPYFYSNPFAAPCSVSFDDVSVELIVTD